MKRQFRASEPNRLWFGKITQHRARDGWEYCAADAFSRRIVGRSIPDRITVEIIVDALDMGPLATPPRTRNSRPCDKEARYTSWLFGHRLHQAGLLGSMGCLASSVDNALIESFWSTMQRELPDDSNWTSAGELTSAMAEWTEGFYNPTPQDTAHGNLSPVNSERLHTPAAEAA